MEMALVLMPCNLKHSSIAIKPMITHQQQKEKKMESLLQCTPCLYCNWKHTGIQWQSLFAQSGVLHRKSPGRGFWNMIDHAASQTSDIVIHMFPNNCIYFYDRLWLSKSNVWYEYPDSGL